MSNILEQVFGEGATQVLEKMASDAVSGAYQGNDPAVVQRAEELLKVASAGQQSVLDTLAAERANEMLKIASDVVEAEQGAGTSDLSEDDMVTLRALELLDSQGYDTDAVAEKVAQAFGGGTQSPTLTALATQRAEEMLKTAASKMAAPFVPGDPDRADLINPSKYKSTGPKLEASAYGDFDSTYNAQESKARALLRKLRSVGSKGKAFWKGLGTGGKVGLIGGGLGGAAGLTALIAALASNKKKNGMVKAAEEQLDDAVTLQALEILDENGYDVESVLDNL